MFTYSQQDVKKIKDHSQAYNIEASVKMLKFIKEGKFKQATDCLHENAHPLYATINSDDLICSENVLNNIFHCYWNNTAFYGWPSYDPAFDDCEYIEPLSKYEMRAYSEFEEFLKIWKEKGGNFNDHLFIQDDPYHNRTYGFNKLSDFYYTHLFTSIKEDKFQHNGSAYFHHTSDLIDCFDKIMKTSEAEKLEPDLNNYNVLGIMIREAWPYSANTFSSQLNINSNNIIDFYGNTPLHYLYNMRTMVIPFHSKGNYIDIEEYKTEYIKNVELLFPVQDILHIKNSEGRTAMEYALDNKAWYNLSGLIDLSLKHTPDYFPTAEFMNKFENELTDLADKNKDIISLADTLQKQRIVLEQKFMNMNVDNHFINTAKQNQRL